MQFFASSILIVVAFFGACYAQFEPKICWRDYHGRGAGTIPETCLAGNELNGLLCYPLCKDGFYGVGPVCWQTCKPGWIDYGVFCGKGSHTCTKKSYGRTAGKVPGCPKPEVEQAGLCYQACIYPFVGEGPVCWSSVGDATYTVLCDNKISFGATNNDCQILDAYLKKSGLTSWQCLYALIESIAKGHPDVPITCIDLVKDVLPTLIKIPTCKAPPPGKE
jgi:hypothetical protein